MLEKIKKKKMNMAMIILFGVVWVLLIPVILGVEKISKQYPKACRRIALAVYLFIMAFCLYVLIMKHQMNYLPILICMILVFCDTMKKEKQL